MSTHVRAGDMRPWRKHTLHDGAMLAARPHQPTAEQAAISDASFLAGYRLAETVIRGAVADEIEALRDDLDVHSMGAANAAHAYTALTAAALAARHGGDA